MADFTWIIFLVVLQGVQCSAVMLEIVSAVNYAVPHWCLIGSLLGDLE